MTKGRELLTREQAMDDILELVGKHVGTLHYEADQMRRDILAVLREREQCCPEALLFRAILHQAGGHVSIDLRHIVAIGPALPVTAMQVDGLNITWQIVPHEDGSDAATEEPTNDQRT